MELQLPHRYLDSSGSREGAKNADGGSVTGVVLSEEPSSSWPSSTPTTMPTSTLDTDTVAAASPAAAFCSASLQDPVSTRPSLIPVERAMTLSSSPAGGGSWSSSTRWMRPSPARQPLKVARRVSRRRASSRARALSWFSASARKHLAVWCDFKGHGEIRCCDDMLFMPSVRIGRYSFANPARGQLNKGKQNVPWPRSRLGIWSRETSSRRSVPGQPVRSPHPRWIWCLLAGFLPLSAKGIHLHHHR